MQQRGQLQRQQEPWQRGWQASNSNKVNGDGDVNDVGDGDGDDAGGQRRGKGRWLQG